MTRVQRPALPGRKLVAVMVAACFTAPSAFGNPVGGTIVSGQASIVSQGSLLTVTNTPGAVLHWQGFSIGAGETTRFVQQSAASSVLNRVVGSDPSVILGTLQSNGRVFLINPSGILVGQGARIDVAGFVASTLNLSNQDFLTGRLNFELNPAAGKVVNEGVISTPSGGSVYLVAPEVSNSGVIRTPQGETILAAGNSVQLLDSSTPGVRVEISAEANKAENLGQIIADSGRVGVVGALVRHKGVINADQVVRGADGKVWLRASKDLRIEPGSRISANGERGGEVTVQAAEGVALVSGSLEARGDAGVGGRIEALGRFVGLADGARLDASGASGGGTVLVGGDLRGANAQVQNAQASLVAPEAEIRADAIEAGEGGKVIVWSEQATRAYGAISARGGMRSGNGGFVETSSRGYLDVARAPDTAAPAGLAGTWLLDPWDIVIDGASSSITSAGANPLTYLSDGSNVSVTPSHVNAATITAALNAGTNVIVDTSGGGAHAGDITVNSPIAAAPSTPTSLTLKAHNNINVNAAIQSTGSPLAITLTADQDNNATGAVTINANLYTNNDYLVINSAQDVTIGAGAAATVSSGNTGNAGTGASTVSITAKNPGAKIDLRGGSQVRYNAGATLRADAMNLAGSVLGNSIPGSIVLRAFDTTRPVRIEATPTASTLSLAPLQLVNLFGGSLDIGAPAAGGDLTVASALNLDSLGVGTLNLYGQTIAVDAPITRAADAGVNILNLSALGNVALNSTIANSPTSGNTMSVAVTAANGNIKFGDGAAHLGIDVRNNNNGATNGGSVSLSAPNGYIDGSTFSGPTALDVIANSLSMSARNGVGPGAGYAIETQVSTLSASNSVSDDVRVFNSLNAGTLTVTAASNAAASGSMQIKESSRDLQVAGNVSSGASGSVTLSGNLGITSNGLAQIQGPGGVFLDSPAGAIANAGTITNGAGAGSITLKADAISLSGPVNAGSGNVVLQPYTAGATIGVAGAAGTLQLSDATLDQISSAGTVYVGNAASGTITIGSASGLTQGSKNLTFSAGSGADIVFAQSSGVTAIGTTGNVALVSGRQVVGTATPGTDVSANSVQLSAATGIGAAGVAIETATPALSFNSTTGDVEISNTTASALSLSGVHSGTGNVNISEATGNLSVTSPGIVFQGLLPVTLKTLGSGKQITVAAGASISNTVNGGPVKLYADDVDIAGNITLAGAGVRTVSIAPTDPARTIAIGAASGGLVIDNGELGRMSAAGIEIGTAAQTGDITFTQASFGPKSVLAQQSLASAGRITLDDTGGTSALAGTGSVYLAAGTGGIRATAGTTASTTAEIETTGAVTLITRGSIGNEATSERIQLTSSPASVIVGSGSDKPGFVGLQHFTATPATLQIGSIAASGNIEVLAKDGIRVNASVDNSAGGSATSMLFKADSDGSGAGTFTLAGSGSITTASTRHVFDASGGTGGGVALVIKGADIDLLGPIAVPADADVALRPVQAGAAVDVGTAATASFVVSSSDIANIGVSLGGTNLGGIVHIGSNNLISGDAAATDSGAMQVNGLAAAGKRIHLISGSTIDDANAGTAVTALGLGLSAKAAIGAASGADGFTVDVSNLRVRRSGGANVTITDVGSGNLALHRATTEGAGTITISKAAGTLALAPYGGFTGEEVRTAGAGADIALTAPTLTVGLPVSAGNRVTYTADSMTLGSTTTATADRVLLQTKSSSAVSIDVGGSDSAGVLGLTGAELATLSAPLLQVGGYSSVPINLSSAVTLTPNVSLFGGAITQSAGAGIDTSASNAGVTLTGTTVGAAGSPISVRPGSGSVSATATSGGIFLTQPSGDLTVGALSGVSVTLNASGAIRDGNGAGANNVTATGALVLSATSGIDLDTATPALRATNSASGDVNLRNTGALILQGIVQDGANLLVSASGAITQGATSLDAIRVAGTSGFSAGANRISLDNAANQFGGAVSLSSTGSANPVTLASSGALVMGATSVGSNSLALTAGGAITQVGGLSAGSLTTVSSGGTVLEGANAVAGFAAANSGSGDIRFSNAAASLAVGGITQGGGEVAVNQSGALSVTGPISTGNGGVLLQTSAGSITVGSRIAAGGTVVLTAGGAASDVLVDADVQSLSAGVAASAGRNVTLNAGGLSAATSVSLSAAAGGIAEAGAGSIAAASLLTASASGTRLDNANVVAAFHATNSGGDLQLTNAHGLAVDAISQSGGGNLVLNVTGELVLNRVAVGSGGGAQISAGGGIRHGSASVDIDTSSGNGAVTLHAAAIGISGAPLQINAGSGTVRLTTTGTDAAGDLYARFANPLANIGITTDPGSVQTVSVATTGTTANSITVSGAISTNDAVRIASAGDVHFAAGTTFAAASLALSGSGSANFPSGSVSVDAPLSATLPVNVSGATVDFNAAYSAGTTAVSGGAVNFNSNARTVQLVQTGGTVGGTGNLAVTDAFSQSAGSFGARFSNLSIRQGSGNLAVGAMGASGSLLLDAAAGSLTATGTLSAGSTVALSGQGVSVAAVNGGTIAIDANTGVLDISGPVTSGGNPIALAGADINLGASVNAGAGLVAIVNRSGGAVTLGGSTPGQFSLSSAELGRITAGSLVLELSPVTIDAPISLTSVGSLSMSASSLAVNSTLSTAGALAIDCTGDVTVSAGAVPAGLSGSSVNVAAANVTLIGGSAPGALAAIRSTSGDVTLSMPNGVLKLIAGTAAGATPQVSSAANLAIAAATCEACAGNLAAAGTLSVRAAMPVAAAVAAEAAAEETQQTVVTSVNTSTTKAVETTSATSTTTGATIEAPTVIAGASLTSGALPAEQPIKTDPTGDAGGRAGFFGGSSTGNSGSASVSEPARKSAAGFGEKNEPQDKPGESKLADDKQAQGKQATSARPESKEEEKKDDAGEKKETAKSDGRKDEKSKPTRKPPVCS